LVIAPRLLDHHRRRQIIVLGQGRLAERGTHHQLLPRAGSTLSLDRQREPRRRAKLAQVDDEAAAPHRNPPTVESVAAAGRRGATAEPPIERADAAAWSQCRSSRPSAPSRAGAPRGLPSSAGSRWRACSCSGCGRRSAARHHGALVRHFSRSRARDADREAIVVSPADGRVSRIVNAVPPKELGLGERTMARVSIFMSGSTAT